MTVVHLHAEDDDEVVPDAGGAVPEHADGAAFISESRPAPRRRKERPVRVGPGPRRPSSRLILMGGGIVAAATIAGVISYLHGFNQVAMPSGGFDPGQHASSPPPSADPFPGIGQSASHDQVHPDPAPVPAAIPPAPSSDLLFQEMIERLERIETVAKRAADKPTLAAEISKAVLPLVERLAALESEVRELKKTRLSPQQVRVPAAAAPAPAPAAPTILAPAPSAPCVIRGWSFVGTHRNLVWLQREGTSSPIRYTLGETVQTLGRLLEVKQDGAGQWYVDVNSGSGSCRISQAVK